MSSHVVHLAVVVFVSGLSLTFGLLMGLSVPASVTGAFLMIIPVEAGLSLGSWIRRRDPANRDSFRRGGTSERTAQGSGGRPAVTARSQGTKMRVLLLVMLAAHVVVGIGVALLLVTQAPFGLAIAGIGLILAAGVVGIKLGLSMRRGQGA
jgi:hypothetical protein